MPNLAYGLDITLVLQMSEAILHGVGKQRHLMRSQSLHVACH